VREGWQAVDASGEAPAYIDYLRTVSAVVAVQRYKRTTIELMEAKPGDRVLDVGCGRGDEVRALAEIVGPTGVAVGIDASDAMVAEARRMSSESRVRAEFHIGDAEALPFENASFAAARIERTLQHVPDPDKAVRELRRVCRSGARVVAMEPDWGTMVVDSDDEDTTRLLTRVHAAHVTHGQMGRELWRRLRAAGFKDLVADSVMAHVSDFATADAVLQLVETADEAVRDRAIDRAAGDRWLSGLRAADAKGQFFAALGGFIVVGTVP
jgi:SAM-dependent methyltransferase